eukprot:764280-Hanusia_phi.AAC.11
MGFHSVYPVILPAGVEETSLNDPLPPSPFERTSTEYTTWKVRGTSQHRQAIDYIFMSDGFEPVKGQARRRKSSYSFAGFTVASTP